MSAKISSFNWVSLLLESKELSANATYIGLYLATFMNAHNEMAWPSLKRIQAETKLSKNTVIKYLKELEDTGWVITKRQTKVVQTSGGMQACNRYWINVPKKVVQEMNHLNAKGVEDMNHPEQGSSSGGTRGFISEPKVVQEVNPNNNIITNNNNVPKNQKKDEVLDDPYGDCPF